MQPTSGLDSTTALKLVYTMRSLAYGGRTVIASIHQPSSRLYQQMDKVGGYAMKKIGTNHVSVELGTRVQEMEEMCMGPVAGG